MADHLLFISWGQVVRGREALALENFGEAVAYYGRLQANGVIEGFDVALLDPHGGIDGFIMLRGTREALATLRGDEEFRRLLAGSSMIVDDMRLIDGVTGDALGEEMGRFAEVIAGVPQAVA